MSKLVFGALQSVVAIGFNSEIKENLSMKNGLATVEQVDLQTKTNEDTNEEYPAIAIRMRSVEEKNGTGAYDTITSRTPSKTILGLERLKYLFNALGKQFPVMAFMHYAMNGAKDAFTELVCKFLEHYQENGGNVAEVALLDAEGRIVIANVTAFKAIFGDDSGVTYLYANLGKVGDIRAKHQAKLAAEKDPAQRELLKQAYYAVLDAEPVVPCKTNIEEFRQLYELAKALPTDQPVYVKTDTKGGFGKQVKSYMVARPVEA
jgi:hypothetical protein